MKKTVDILAEFQFYNYKNHYHSKSVPESVLFLGFSILQKITLLLLFRRPLLKYQVLTLPSRTQPITQQTKLSRLYPKGIQGWLEGRSRLQFHEKRPISILSSNQKFSAVSSYILRNSQKKFWINSNNSPQAQLPNNLQKNYTRFTSAAWTHSLTGQFVTIVTTCSLA